MTGEEAIRILKSKMDGHTDTSYEWAEAVRMAIKALKQEPTAKNDLGVDCIVDILGSYTDLDIPYKREIAENILTKLSSVTPQSCDAISREEAIDTIRQLYLDLASQKAVIDILKVLPSVTPQETRKGHWIEVTNGRGGHECDVCHDYAPSFQSGDEYLSQFCPNCGAKMIKSQESEG